MISQLRQMLFLNFNLHFVRICLHLSNICNHRWARVLGQGGCVHTGCVRKKFCGRLWWPQHRGVNFWEIFHPGVCGCAQGCEFQKNFRILVKKILEKFRRRFAALKFFFPPPTPGCEKFFFAPSPTPQGAHPLCLRQGGVSGDFRFLGGCAHPTHPPPCPSMWVM